MGVKPGDIIDEKKNYEQSCGFVATVTEGGAGFEKVLCCGYDLDERDLTEALDESIDRFPSSRSGSRWLSWLNRRNWSRGSTRKSRWLSMSM